tara:strand:+ start:560 stop:1228 length:669 start_codon:yes stop_codon:yes gene_type:complete
MKLLTHSAAKIDKSQNDKWLNAVLYLDPHFNNQVCKGASKGCKQSCLINSGRMIMASAVNARQNRTAYYFNDNDMFMLTLKGEIAALLYKATKQGKRLAIRLNGTSDIDWQEVYKAFKGVQFYEYTKRPDLAKKLNKIENVHITFSKHENHSTANVKKLLDSGINVAVVFNKQVPTEYIDIQVIDGDKHDRRFEDTQGHIIGLKLKGTNKVKALAIDSGFAV